MIVAPLLETQTSISVACDEHTSTSQQNGGLALKTAPKATLNTLLQCDLLPTINQTCSETQNNPKMAYLSHT